MSGCINIIFLEITIVSISFCAINPYKYTKPILNDIHLIECNKTIGKPMWGTVGENLVRWYMLNKFWLCTKETSFNITIQIHLIYRWDFKQFHVPLCFEILLCFNSHEMCVNCELLRFWTGELLGVYHIQGKVLGIHERV